MLKGMQLSTKLGINEMYVLQSQNLQWEYSADGGKKEEDKQNKT